MTFPGARPVAILVVLLLTLLDVSVEAQTRKKKKTPPKKKAAATRKVAPKPAVSVPVGATFEERLSSLVNGTVARSSDASIQIVELESGRSVAERNPHMSLSPASNMKLFTTAAAIDMLEPSFEVATGVYTRGEIDASGTLNGDVKIVGRGDPTIGGRFHDGAATAVLQEWATDLKRSGIRNVTGNLIFEYGYMDTEYIHPTWPVDQLVNWYEAPIAAFSMQEGCVEVRVLPSRVGQPCVVQLEPPTSYLQVQNTCKTGRGLPFITRHRGSNTVIVRGGVPARSGRTEVFVTVENPVHYFATVTGETFARAGIRVMGETTLIARDSRTDWKLVSQHTTPLSTLIYVINKKSQNHYAEQVLKMIGAEERKQGSWAAGNAEVKEWLTTKIGVPASEFHPVDGSGMSRDNRASANAFISLLRYMWKSPWREEFVSSLPYTGDPDSKFGNRLRRPPFARQIYAKTGYISGVIGLSGYVHAQSGKVYAFSFLFNRYRVGVFAVYNLQDEMLKEIVTSG
ncbi:MAG TPA: D-alanyl-D-alanine carboxypeptidase/D-alanyl-D-alanine-endopeptidase [Thermoanaerobaculia bacterium]|jgi:D-alanyl-D-alanine carboxypeptidase/D-alanyl-D-alanine-endopeptidase (penicillin-binding protein 4)|nr:D-alanyl-D-alanine carboxypeptidase/D-alanyl-D-alanine-endopeptidase [Thermoanaerobaculia bacterium]